MLGTGSLAEYSLKLLGYGLYFSIVVLGLYHKKSKRITLLIGAYMWFLVAFNTSSADYYAFEEMFLCAFEPRYAGHEFLFLLLCRVCLFVGLSYLQFRCVIAFFIVVVSVRAISFYTNNINRALSLYLVFPFMASASGLRQACSSAVVLYSVKFLMSNKKKDVYKYILCIIVATFFHYSSLFYLIFILAVYINTNTTTTLVQCLLMVTGLLIVAQTNILYIVASKLTSREKTLYWLRLSQHVSPLYVISIGLFMLFLYALYQAREIIKIREKERSHLLRAHIKYWQVERVSRMIILSLVAFAGAILRSVVYLRLVLTLIPVGYAVCCDAFVECPCEPLLRQRVCKQLKYGMIFYCAFTTVFVYGYWIGGSTLSVPVGNSIFGG